MADFGLSAFWKEGQARGGGGGGCSLVFPRACHPLRKETRVARLTAPPLWLSEYHVLRFPQVLTDFVGTVDYMSPELLNRHYGPETDVWCAAREALDKLMSRSAAAAAAAKRRRHASADRSRR